MASIIKTMQEWLNTCPFLDEFSGGHIDWTDNTALDYGIMPTGSAVVQTEEDVRKYLNINTLAVMPVEKRRKAS